MGTFVHLPIVVSYEQLMATVDFRSNISIPSHTG